MTILVTGSTGVIGTEVLAHLQGHDVAVRALTRSPEKARLPHGVTAVRGDPADVDSMREAMAGVSTLFLLVPGVGDELTQAMLTLNVARDAGVKGIVYLSVFKGDDYVDVPHFASKRTVERMIGTLDLPATILQPAYFIQNDLRQKDGLLGHGVYGMPVGSKGLSMVDTRDIGEAAARELLRREGAAAPLPRATFPLVGPDRLDGVALTALWSDVLDRPIRYGGDDLDALEKRMKTFSPNWLAYDLRLMMARYQEDGAAASADQIAQTTEVLGGRAPRGYRAFAEAAAAQWATA